MFLSLLRIENFRAFGEGSDGLTIELNAGLTAIVGENDTGKTAIMDALRLALGTRDQEFFRVEETDFHHRKKDGCSAKEIRIQCRFDGLTLADKAAFAEHLTYEIGNGSSLAILILNWKATASPVKAGARRFTYVETRSGKAADGPQFDHAARALLCATYLRPLRDAERAMSAGRGSRLSQILQHTKEIKEHGVKFDPKANPPPDPQALSVLGLGDYTSHLIENSHGVKSTRQKLNDD